MILATQADVEKRLGRGLTSEEEERLDGLLEEASALVEGYLGVQYDDDPDTDAPEPPPVVALVVSGIVARALIADSSLMGVAAMSESQQAGPFATRFRDSNVYLTKGDKLKLRIIGGGFTSIPLKSERGYPDPEEDE